jgi:hypothetical protein
MIICQTDKERYYKVYGESVRGKPIDLIIHKENGSIKFTSMKSRFTLLLDEENARNLMEALRLKLEED